jgi:hypothetical protein
MFGAEISIERRGFGLARAADAEAPDSKISKPFKPHQVVQIHRWITGETTHAAVLSARSQRRRAINRRALGDRQVAAELGFKFLGQRGSPPRGNGPAIKMLHGHEESFPRVGALLLGGVGIHLGSIGMHFLTTYWPSVGHDNQTKQETPSLSGVHARLQLCFSALSER